MTALTPAQKERQRFARARAGQIRFGMQNYIETLGVIAIARAEEDHLALGYESWAAYVDGEFGDARIQLPPEMRRKAVEELRLAGASQREIGHTLGVSHTQVRRDLAGTNVPPEPARSPLVEAITGAIEEATERAETAGSVQGRTDPAQTGLAGPEEEADAPAASSHASSTAAAGDRVDAPAAAPEDHPDVNASDVPGDGAPSAGAPEHGGPATSPAGPPCENCGAEILPGQADAGYTRCDPCDPEGDHVDDGNGCKVCAAAAEAEGFHLGLSIGDGVIDCGECDGIAALLDVGRSLAEVLADAREHVAACRPA